MQYGYPGVADRWAVCTIITLHDKSLKSLCNAGYSGEGVWWTEYSWTLTLSSLHRSIHAMTAWEKCVHHLWCVKRSIVEHCKATPPPHTSYKEIIWVIWNGTIFHFHSASRMNIWLSLTLFTKLACSSRRSDQSWSVPLCRIYCRMRTNVNVLKFVPIPLCWRVKSFFFQLGTVLSQ